MILSDKDIKKSLEEKQITVDPLFPNSIQPASVDVHLGADFLIFDSSSHTAIDVKKPIDDMMKSITINNDKQFVLHPGEFALGMTYETIGLPDNVVGHLDGKSSLGRIGLIVHATAGYIDPGNKLKITLELHNIANLPIVLYYKMPIGQMTFVKLSSEAEVPYGKGDLGSKYYGAMKPQASQYYKNFEKNNEWLDF
ncbi:MAG: dCTP deaminase [Candidatus Doudnabacteria bacterium]